MKKEFLDLTLVLAVLFAVGLGCNQLPISTQQAQQTPPPAATPTQTPDETNEKLLEKLAELEKKIDDQQKQAKATPPVIRTPTRASVNSPGDGFLALRSDPSSDIGYRILQIPHGAEVRVLSCQNRSTRISGRNGRWCRVRYDGTTGWAFDAWLVY